MLYGRMAELMGRVELRREPLACDMGEGNTLLVTERLNHLARWNTILCLPIRKLL